MGSSDIGIPHVGEAQALSSVDWLDVFWQQRTLGALQDTLDVPPELKAQMIQFLFEQKVWNSSTLSWEAATTRFNACLNPGKPEKFALMELWALMKRFDRHQLFLSMADDLGYEVRRKPTEERRQDIMARAAAAIERSANEAAMLRSDLLRLGMESPAVRVHGAILAGRPVFTLPESAGEG